MTKTLRTALGGMLASAAITCLAVLQATAQQSIEVHNTMGAGGSEDAAIQRFSEFLNERAPGRFDVVPYLGGQLGSEVDVLELLNLGQTQISLTGGLFMNQYATEYDAVSVPFVFPDWASVEHFMVNTDTGRAIQAQSRERGNIVYLGPQMRAFRHMTSNRAINTPDDLQGLTMRLPQIPIWLDVWGELGVQPVVIPAPDIYFAMRTGQVQAHENSLASPYTRQMWEVQDYIIMTAHLSFPWHWVASARWWDGLSAEDQALITEAVEVARAHGFAVEQEADDYYRVELISNGMTFIDVDQAPFREVARPAVERILSGLADGVTDDIEAAIAATR